MQYEAIRLNSGDIRGATFRPHTEVCVARHLRPGTELQNVRQVTNRHTIVWLSW